MTYTKNFYKTLEIPKDASDDDIKKAYRNLAKKFHPDKNSDAGAEEKFKEIGAAYETLKDASKRRTYDMQQADDAEKAKMRREGKGKGSNGFSSGAGTTGFSFTRSTNGAGPYNFRSTFNMFDEDSDFFKRSRSDFFNENLNKGSSSSSTGKTGASSQGKSRKRKDGAKPTPHQRRTNDFSRPEWNSNWHEDTHPESTGEPNLFSFTFDFFNKQREDPFFNIEDPFADMETVFEEFFKDPFFPKTHPMFPRMQTFFNAGPTANGGASRRRPRASAYTDRTAQDNTDTSEGVYGSTPRRRQQRARDDLEDMWDWNNPIFGQKKTDEEEYVIYDSEEEVTQVRLPCSYCGRKFVPTSLTKHEAVCRRWHTRDAHRNAATSNASKTNHSTPNHSSTNHNTTNNTHTSSFTFDFGNSGAANGGETSDYDNCDDTKKSYNSSRFSEDNADLLNDLLNSRRATRTQRQQSHEDDKPEVYMSCQHCGRSFSEAAAARHIPQCAAHTRTHGEPANPPTRASPPRYSSKEYTAKQYAKNIPKPSPRRAAAGPSTSNDVPPKASTSSSNSHATPTTRHTSTPRASSAHGLRTRPGQSSTGMGSTAGGTTYTPRTPAREPTYTSTTGLGGVTGKPAHYTSTPHVSENSPTDDPSVRPKRATSPAKRSSRPTSAARKGSPKKSTINLGADLGASQCSQAEGCGRCQKVYGSKAAKFACSCGLRTACL